MIEFETQTTRHLPPHANASPDRPPHVHLTQHRSFADRISSINIPVLDVLAMHLATPICSGRGFVLITCPSESHDDKNPSFGVNIVTGRGRCFGCGFWTGDIVALHCALSNFTSMGEALSDLEGTKFCPKKSIPKSTQPKAKTKRKSVMIGKPTVVARFDYFDENHQLAFSIERTQFKLDNGEWFRKSPKSKVYKEYFPRGASGERRIPPKYSKGKLRPLYALSAITTQSIEDRIIVVEGEPSAEALLERGYLATTSSGGSSLAAKTDWSPLAGRRVLIWPDNDAAGAKYAILVKSILNALTPSASCRIADISPLNLPHGGDAVDWVNSLKEEAK